MNNSEHNARTMELIKTVNSPGWLVAISELEAVINEAIEAVWACKDKGLRDDLVLKAQAAKELLTNFKYRIEVAKGLVPANHAYDAVMTG